jgi:hypothetical protein
MTLKNNFLARDFSKINPVDLAKKHFMNNFPDSLPIENAYTHIGVYLGWAIENELYSEFFQEESAVQIYRFKRREISCTILSELWDGYLGTDLFNEAGANFTFDYYLSGDYLRDYKSHLAREYNSIYEVSDNWSNFERMIEKINERFEEWKKARKVQT